MTKSANREIKSMRNDVEQKIGNIMSDLQQKGPEAVARAEQALGDLREDLQDRLTDIHDTLDESVETGRQQIRERPLLAIGVAVGVGVVLGMLLGRTTDER